MKFNKIKAFIFAASLALLMGNTSCVGDLDVTPINPQQTMEADNDALFNKVYASFALTGQTGLPEAVTWQTLMKVSPISIVCPGI